MRLHKRVKVQLAIFIVVSLIATAVLVFGYLKAPAVLFGIGRYTVSVELTQSGGLYKSANVTYRGTTVGRVQDIQLSPDGAHAVLSLKSGIDIPSDLQADVHSQSAIGEQYVALVPRSDAARPLRDGARPLRDGDVITAQRSSVPPDINDLLNTTNSALQAIPNDNLKTLIDESYTALGGLGPELSRVVDGSTALAIDAKNNLGALTNVVDSSHPILDAQVQTADAVTAWAANLAKITNQVEVQDNSVSSLLKHSGPSAREVQALLDRIRPTLPVILANLVSVGDVALAYQNDVEQLLVLIPHSIDMFGAVGLAQAFTKQDYKGASLSFNTNVNLPPPCTTGYLPASQRRSPIFEDYPDRPIGDFYCRVAQDSPLNVRGARNIPCETRPGKRAATVKLCESNEEYAPLNDGYNWKGDPNATLSGQDVPQILPDIPSTAIPAPSPPRSGDPAQTVPQAAPAAPPALAIAEYDPATGSYVGPDGRVYTQTDLAKNNGAQTWQSMLLPPQSSPR